MKRIGLSLLFVVLLAACNVPASPMTSSQTGLPSGEAATQETVVNVQETPSALLPMQATPVPDEINAPLIESPSIVSLHMLDEVYGWAVTDSQIVRTNDGGVTWYNVSPPGLTETGYGVQTEFLDVTHAWLQVPDPNNYPNSGTMYRTSDGGLTWTTSATPFSGGDIAFVDANNGWVMADLGVGAGNMAVSVFQTTDGGATWDRTYTNDPNLEGADDSLPLGGLKYGIAPINMQIAWIYGVTYSTGTVYLFRTDDGGKRWFQINLVLSEASQNAELSVEKIQFFSPTHGILVMRSTSANRQTILYQTSDGGNTWQSMGAVLPDAGVIEIASASEIIVYGSDQFYVTQDAAASWKIVSPDVVFGEYFGGMSFANSMTGWAIMTDPSGHRTLYKTTDGGATWFPLVY